MGYFVRFGMGQMDSAVGADEALPNFWEVSR